MVQISIPAPGSPGRLPGMAVTIGLLLLLGTSGCSRFSRDWQAAAGNPATGNTLAGRWEGTWKSDSNGHTDRMRCLIRHETNGLYTARYFAWYRRILTFSYDVPLIAHDAGGRQEFKGLADLGWLAGGRYGYEGFSEGTNFFSTYTSKYDSGTFELKRVP
jgi:hypothetical protein